MKKINFIIVLSLLCCSYESMGFARRPGFNRTTVNRQPSIQNQQQTIRPDTVVTDPAYVRPQDANRLLNHINLPSVRTTEIIVGNRTINGNRFALIEVTDLNGQNIRGSCGYNALHTNRRDVYDALVAIFHPARWEEDVRDAQARNVLSRMLRAVMGDDTRVGDEYQPQSDWEAVQNFLQNNIRDGGEVMDQNLALLVCYIRGENLAVVNQNAVGAPIINHPNGITRYLYNSGGHWQELRPYNPR